MSKEIIASTQPEGSRLTHPHSGKTPDQPKAPTHFAQDACIGELLYLSAQIGASPESWQLQAAAAALGLADNPLDIHALANAVKSVTSGIPQTHNPKSLITPR